ncbi:kinase-like domain-containing protein [Rhizophagus irregularis DAOM 181602=DAOM 197198]|nr:kinase-like domain-containing protein [Rhizophagus irregularis DAOM 181602=DAOM 197198]
MLDFSRPERTSVVNKGEIKCKECKIRKIIDENHETCQLCYEIFNSNLSGNKVIDDIIINTRVDFVKGEIYRVLEFVPYDQFKNIEFIAEGGFSKIYKAIWVDGPIDEYYDFHSNTTVRNNNYTVVLKKLNNSKNITSKELNELKSRPLSRMIQSAMSLRSSRSQSIDPFYYYQKNTDKRKFEDDSVEDSNDNEQIIKRRKFLENENSDYFTKEIELDINMSSNQPRDKGYATKEIDLDINHAL